MSDIKEEFVLTVFLIINWRVDHVKLMDALSIKPINVQNVMKNIKEQKKVDVFSKTAMIGLMENASFVIKASENKMEIVLKFQNSLLNVCDVSVQIDNLIW